MVGHMMMKMMTTTTVTRSHVRALQTINIFSMALLQGLVISVFGPSMLDLAHLFHSDIEHVSYLSSSVTIGAMIGCASSDWLYKHWNEKILVVACVLLKGISNALVPQVTSLFYAHVVSLVCGVAMGCLEIGVYVWLISLYPPSQGSAVVLQTYHLMFGLGSLFGSMLVRYCVEENSHVVLKTGPTPAVPADAVPVSRIDIAFGVTAVLAVVLAASVVVGYRLEARCVADRHHVERRRRRSQDKHSPAAMKLLIDEVSSNENCLDGTNRLAKNRLSIFLSFLVGTHCLMLLLILLCISRYLSVYAVLRGLSKDRSIVLVSTFFTGFTLSRLASIYVASRVQPKAFLIITDFALLMAAVAFCATDSHSESALQATSLLLGATCAPVYAAGTSFLVSRLQRLTHRDTSVLHFMSNTGGLIPPFVIGPIIESTPKIFPEVVLASSLLLFLLMVCVISTDKCSGGERIIEAVISHGLPCTASKKASGEPSKEI